MANKLYEEADIQAIANAIRNKNGSTDTYTVSQMAEAINNIPTKPIKPYTELEYIQSTGTQYIDTRIIGDSTVTVELKINRSTSTTASQFFGSWSSSYCIMAEIHQNKWVLMSNVTSNALELSISNRDNVIMKITPSVMQLYDWNNNLITSKSITSGSWTTDLNMYLFARNRSLTTDYGTFKIYYCKIYNNNTLVRDFIPVIRTEDEKVCLYDKVTETFFTNQGTGTFIAGPDKEV